MTAPAWAIESDRMSEQIRAKRESLQHWQARLTVQKAAAQAQRVSLGQFIEDAEDALDRIESELLSLQEAEDDLRHECGPVFEIVKGVK